MRAGEKTLAFIGAAEKAGEKGSGKYAA